MTRGEKEVNAWVIAFQDVHKETMAEYMYWIWYNVTLLILSATGNFIINGFNEMDQSFQHMLIF